MFRYFVETNDCLIIEVFGYRGKDGSGYETFDEYRKLFGDIYIESHINTWLVTYKDLLVFQKADNLNHFLTFSYIRYFWVEEWHDECRR